MVLESGSHGSHPSRSLEPIIRAYLRLVMRDGGHRWVLDTHRIAVGPPAGSKARPFKRANSQIPPGERTRVRVTATRPHQSLSSRSDRGRGIVGWMDGL